MQGIAMLRWIYAAAAAFAVVQASGVLEVGSSRLTLMLLPLSAAVAYVLLKRA